MQSMEPRRLRCCYAVLGRASLSGEWYMQLVVPKLSLDWHSTKRLSYSLVGEETWPSAQLLLANDCLDSHCPT